MGADRAAVLGRYRQFFATALSPALRHIFLACMDKRPFYRANGLDEVVLVDPLEGTIAWFAVNPTTGEYETVAASAVLPIGATELAAVLTA